MADKSVYLKAFNTQFKEFIEDIKVVFPDNSELQINANTIDTLRVANARLVLNIWYQYVAIKYKDQIEMGDAEYFIEKNYSGDINSHDANVNGKYVKFIDSIRQSIRELDDINRSLCMKYIKNLTTLSSMYNN